MKSVSSKTIIGFFNNSLVIPLSIMYYLTNLLDRTITDLFEYI